jgi:hypothetical protein
VIIAIVLAFLVITAFRLLWLSGHYGFPVVLAFLVIMAFRRSLWLSGHFKLDKFSSRY